MFDRVVGSLGASILEDDYVKWGPGEESETHTVAGVGDDSGCRVSDDTAGPEREAYQMVVI